MTNTKTLTSFQQTLDRVVKSASEGCDAPIVWLSLLEKNQYVVQSSVGLNSNYAQNHLNTENHISILSRLENSYEDVFFEVNDISKKYDLKNILFELDSEAKFLSGMFLVDATGTRIGVLCLLDRKTRTLSNDQKILLKDLAKDVLLAHANLRILLVNSELSAMEEAYIVAEYDLEGKIIRANSSFLNFFRCTEAEVLGKKHDTFIPYVQRSSEEYKKFWSTLNSGQLVRGEFKRVTSSETEIWLQSSYTPIYNDKKELIKVIETSQDITQEKITIADNYQRISAMSAFSAIIEFDLTGHVLTANPNFLKIVGYSLEELIGKHHSIMVPISIKESSQYRDFWENLVKGKSQSAIFPRVNKLGHTIFIRGIYNTILDINGTPSKIVKYAYDITEEHVSNLSNKEVRISIDRSTSFAEFDLSGKLIDANENFLKLLKYAKSEIINHSFSVFSSARLDSDNKDNVF